MSSGESINLSNVSPAESSAPLPIPRPATPAPPAMLPRTTQATLAANPDIDAILALPLPPWFRFLLVGPSVDFALLHNALVDHDDWGLTREVHRYCDLDREFSNACVKLEQMQVDLNAISQARTASKTRLLLARASEQVDKLENIPRKTQATRSA